jgi:AcrR family transcriptional regulator
VKYGERVPARTQVERRNQSEEALLEAAAVLVAERGVERTSLANIGVTAGVSRGLPTHHFGSKDSLIARLARQAQDRLDSATRAAQAAAAPEGRNLSGLGRLQTLVETYLKRFQDPTPDDRALIVLWGATFPSAASVKGMVAADQRGFQGLAAVIEAGQEDGSIKASVDPVAAAVAVQAFIRGVAAIYLTHTELTHVDSIRQACQDWIGSALAA